MAKNRKADIFWEKAIEKLNIFDEVAKKGYFAIDESVFKNGFDERYEPRLVTKFDTIKSLPPVFKNGNSVKYSILPYKNSGDYIIVENDVYQKLDIEFKIGMKVNKLEVPEVIKSFDKNEITSEANAINAAMITGMFEHFFKVDRFYAPVSGRKRSTSWTYTLGDSQPPIDIISTQMEIDGTLESEKMFVVIEAKNKLNDDFLIRQLYYPFRDFFERLGDQKPIKSVFLIYNQGIYTIIEYEFSNPYDMLSIEQKRIEYYVIGNQLTRKEISEMYSSISPSKLYENTTFPQADDLFKVLNSLELFSQYDGTGSFASFVASQYQMNLRQGNYYFSSLKFLGLVSSGNEITSLGKEYLKSGFKGKQKILIYQLLQEMIFNEVIRDLLLERKIFRYENYSEKLLGNYGCNSPVTVNRRLSTVKSWVEWFDCLLID